MLRALVTVVVALLVAGCFGNGPAIDYDPAFATQNLHRFRIEQAAGTQDPLDAERIEQAIAGNLRAKGYRAGDPADFVMRYRLVMLENRPSSVSFGFGVGSYGRHGGGSVGASITPSYDAVRLHVEAIDPRHGTVFWSARIEEKLPESMTPQSRQSFYNALVYRLLKPFPRANTKENTP